MQRYCNGNPRTIITTCLHDTTVSMTIKDLQMLISNGEETNDMTLESYLSCLSAAIPRITYLPTHFSSILHDKGWEHAQKFFAGANRRRTRRSTSRPHMSGERVILIPYFINTNHWVAVARYESIQGVSFYYSDDLNCHATEQRVQQALQHTNTAFYPASTNWVRCSSTSYTPHSNECGLRALLALTLFAIQENPPTTILCPWMHTNLAQILRTWVAKTILTSNLDLAPFTTTNMNLTRSFAITDTSKPASLIPWPNRPTSLAPIIARKARKNRPKNQQKTAHVILNQINKYGTYSFPVNSEFPSTFPLIKASPLPHLPKRRYKKPLIWYHLTKNQSIQAVPKQQQRDQLTSQLLQIRNP